MINYLAVEGQPLLTDLIVEGSSSSELVRITQTGTGNALLVEDSANPDSTPFAITGGGSVLSGGLTSYSMNIFGTSGGGAGAFSTTPRILSHTFDIFTGVNGGYQWSNGTTGAMITLGKSRGTAVGDMTIVQQNDQMAVLQFGGADSAKMAEGARITASVDGTPGLNSMPGRLTFSTSPINTSSPTERMRITSDGFVGIGASAPTVRLEVTGSNTVSSQNNVSGAFGTTTSGRLLLGSITGNTPFIGSEGATNLLFTTNATERMRITADGNVAVDTNTLFVDSTNDRVGIGNTSPSATLDIFTASGSFPSLRINNLGTGPSLLVQDDTSPDTTPFIINESGNVGIGLLSPTVKLEVVGTVSATTFTGNANTATTSTGATGVGYMGLPQNASLAGNISIASSDAGKHIYSTATRTATIPANANVAMAIGTTITFIAGSGATVTIAITTDTLLLAGPGTTGSRTLAPFGIATAVKIASTTWIISGNGLT